MIARIQTRGALKRILTMSRSVWDNPESRPSVRENFDKVTKCGTAALGAEVYESDTERKLVFHTCKSRACPSCGHLRTLVWLEELSDALPDIAYKGIVLTMPDVLWKIFKVNRHLLNDLPALGASAVQHWLNMKYGIQFIILAIPHTFGGRLNFNTHIHMLVSAQGLDRSSNAWSRPVAFDTGNIMHIWRYAVIAYLRRALKAGVLSGVGSNQEIREQLTIQYERWWNVHIDHVNSKHQFIQYIGRYVRRPPITQHRIIDVADGHVQFWAKDTKGKRMCRVRLTIHEFIQAFADHVPDRYRHSIRYFGLLSPTSKARSGVARLTTVGQPVRCKPTRLKWAESIKKDFGVDPLIDSQGGRMQWTGRLAPVMDEKPYI